MLACLGFSVAAVACTNKTGENSDSLPPSASDSTDTPIPADYVYCISVKNAGGFGFNKVDVKLMNGNEEVISAASASIDSSSSSSAISSMVSASS